MELGDRGVAAMATGRLLVSVANSLAAASAENLQVCRTSYPPPTPLIPYC